MPTTFTAETYRTEAERVRLLTEAADSDVIRELLDLAQQYEDLAALAETENQAADADPQHRDKKVLRL